MSRFTTRFAPSPTGYLHLGHAYAALTAARAAAVAGGRFLLRIEDIDVTRCKSEFDTAILDDLAWLGLTWETPVRRQSEHLTDYFAALAKLRDQGLLYRCFKTRREVLDDISRAPHGPGEGDNGAVYCGGPLPHDQEAGLLAQNRPFAWRLSLDRAAEALGGFGAQGFLEEAAGPAGETGDVFGDPTREGDVILARKDVGVSYHLAVVVDDALQGVTHVVRGCDLFAATHVQVLLQALLGLPTPVYRHHPLLLGPDGKRLAKRNGAQSLRALRAQGLTPADIRMRLGLAVETGYGHPAP